MIGGYLKWQQGSRGQPIIVKIVSEKYSSYLMKSKSQLRWQCRRGTKELDSLLESYLDCFYFQSSNVEKSYFNELLQIQDNELIRYLLGSQLPDSKGLTKIVKKIRNNSGI